MTPGEIVAACAAVISMATGGLGAYLRAKLQPIEIVVRQNAGRLDRIAEVVDELEGSESNHRNAGTAWAHALHAALHRHGIDAPHPRDFPGL